MNTNKPITIPHNIHIKIINILSTFINNYKIIPYNNNKYNNHLEWFQYTNNFYKQLNHSLLLNISLVSWSWFKILSSLITTKYLYFNKPYYTNNHSTQYSITKFNKTESLLLHIQDINSLNIEIIKSHIKNMKYLKEIIINSSINNLNQFILDIPFSNIIISNFEINHSFKKLPYNMTKVKLLTITQQPIDKSILLELFKRVDFINLAINNNGVYLNSILKQVIKSGVNGNNKYSNISKSSATVFKFTKSIQLNYSQSLESINYMLKLSPNLKCLSIKLCYKNLIYCLSGNERDESSICSCTNNNSGSGSFESFMKQWSIFSALIISFNKYLKSFELSNHCPLQIDNANIPNGYNSNNNPNKIDQLPSLFVRNFSSVFIKNKSIRKLSLCDLQTQVRDFIIMNNTNLTHYK